MDETIKVNNSVRTGHIKPMDRREVPVTIRGLNLNTPDGTVIEYLNKHGKVVNERPIYETEVDFTRGRNLGSFHIIDGAKVQVTYAGQRRTCGRCQKTSRDCPGGGLARQCETNNGKRVKLIDHMRAHWKEIGFEPNLFELDDIDEVFEEPEMKSSQRFTPKKAPIDDSDLETYSGVMVKNLPKEISEEDARKFLETKGMPEGQVFVVMRAGKGTTIEIENLDKVLLQLQSC